MATALQMEEEVSLERAADHYRRALELDPGHVKCLADLGLLLIRMGQMDDGVARLRQAVEQVPTEAEILAKLVKGLRLALRRKRGQGFASACSVIPTRPASASCGRRIQLQQARQQRDAEGSESEGSDPAPAPVCPPGERDSECAGTPTILRQEDARVGRLPHRRGQRNVQ